MNIDLNNILNLVANIGAKNANDISEQQEGLSVFEQLLGDDDVAQSTVNGSYMAEEDFSFQQGQLQATLARLDFEDGQPLNGEIAIFDESELSLIEELALDIDTISMIENSLGLSVSALENMLGRSADATSGFETIANKVINLFDLPLSSPTVMGIEDGDLSSNAYLVIAVPLKSIATGHLSQTKNVSERFQSEIQNAQEQKVKSRFGLGSAFFDNALPSPNSVGLTKKSNGLNPQLLNSAQFNNHSTIESRRTESTHYGNLASFANNEWLSKKLTVIKTQEGLSVLYRDYIADSTHSEKVLNDLTAFLKLNNTIKNIRFNGNLMFSNNTQTKVERG